MDRMDEVILTAAADGDARSLAFSAVYPGQAAFVWATLQHMGVRPADLEDVFQEVFVVVHRRLSTYDGSCLVTTWLYGIALRLVANYRRRAWRRLEKLEEAPHDAQVRSHEASPEEALADRQAREQLGAILDEMNPEKRAVFVMFEIEQMPCDAIAAVVGAPVGTVHSRLHSARAQFEKLVARATARAAQGARR